MSIPPFLLKDIDFKKIPPFILETMTGHKMALMAGLSVLALLSLLLLYPLLWYHLSDVSARNSLNCLIISIDALRSDALGSYGYGKDTSPEIDKLGRGGVLFENCYAQGSWTSPQVATLFTGLYPQSHGLESVRFPLRDELLTLAEIFSSAGYSTACFSSNYLVSRRFNFHQGFSLFKEDFRLVFEPRELKMDGAAASCLKFLGRRGRRFFAYLHLMGLHEPYARGLPSIPPPPLTGDPELDRTYLPVLMKGNAAFIHSRIRELKERLGPEKIEEYIDYLREIYDMQLRKVDREIGEIVRGLRRGGILENTLLVLTSDHGEEFFDHGGLTHDGTLYRELLHTPLIFHLGSKFSPSRVKVRVRTIDIAPTILETFDLPPLPACEGSSLLPFLKGEPLPVHPAPVFSSYGETEEVLSIMEGDYKLIREKDGHGGIGFELYHLPSDPYEKDDLSGREEETARALSSRLEKWLMGFEPPSRQKPIEFTDREVERLRALGYIE